MDEQIAMEVLSIYEDKKPSEIAKALDVLYELDRTCKKVGERINKSHSFVTRRRKISKLPAGIQWKIDEGQIGVEQGYHLSRLEKEEDQWLLAMVFVETENFTIEKCDNVVNLVLKNGKTIIEALLSWGISCDKIISLITPMKFDVRLSVCKIAWEQHKDWKEFCYQFLRESIAVPSCEDVP